MKFEYGSLPKKWRPINDEDRKKYTVDTENAAVIRDDTCPMCGERLTVICTKDRKMYRESCSNCHIMNTEPLRMKKNSSGIHEMFSDNQLSAWSHQVFGKYGRTCIICGSSLDVHAHHIIEKQLCYLNGHPELVLDVRNGIPVCRLHHSMIHPFMNTTYKNQGGKNNETDSRSETDCKQT